MIEYTVRVHCSGTRFWYLNGQLHREDGPACEFAGGTRCWFLNDVEYTEKEFNEKPKQSSKI